MIRVCFVPESEKALNRLDKKIQKRIWRHIEYLKQQPLYGELLNGPLYPYRKVKVPPLRIIYSFDSKAQLIIIQAVGYRGDIYKKL